jgi:aminopeptidase
MRDPRLTKLAHLLVTYSTEVKPGQLVRVNGNTESLPLVRELHRAILAAGAHPLVRIADPELHETLLRHGSDAQLAFIPESEQREWETVDVYIGLWADANTRALTSVDPSRSAIQNKARKPLLDTMLKRAAAGEMRWCGTQYPTQASAQDAEMSLTEYEDFVFSAGLLDHADPAASWRQVRETQQRLVDHLTGKKDLHLKAANGTDLRWSVAGRTWINCAGRENFPDGEVFTGPVLDSVNGTVCYSFPAVDEGREVTDVRLTFRDGKVVDADAGKGLDYLISTLDTDAGARFLGECAIGTNFAITRYTRNTLFDEKIGGTMHFAIGAGYPETGNTNESAVHWDMVVDLRPGGTLIVDGEPLLVDGRFTRPGFPSPRG